VTSSEISSVTVGNASDDQDKGWFIGQFVSLEYGLRQSGDIEIKWGVEHSWYSEVDSLVLTIRTPSVQNDQEHFDI